MDHLESIFIILKKCDGEHAAISSNVFSVSTCNPIILMHPNFCSTLNIILLEANYM